MEDPQRTRSKEWLEKFGRAYDRWVDIKSVILLILMGLVAIALAIVLISKL